MAKIKIKDLSHNMSITEEEFNQIMGGFNPQPEPPRVYNPGRLYATVSDYIFSRVNPRIIDPVDIVFRKL